MKDIKGEGVFLAKPPCGSGLQIGNQFFFHVEVGGAGQTEEIFQVARCQHIDVHGLDVHRVGTQTLIGIHIEKGTLAMSDLTDCRNVLFKPVLIVDLRNRGDKRSFVNRSLIGGEIYFPIDNRD